MGQSAPSSVVSAIVNPATAVGGVLAGGLGASVGALQGITGLLKPKPLALPPLPEQSRPASAADPDAVARIRRSRDRATAAYGRRDTILTSPLGVPGDGGGTRKTLLGE